MSGIEGLGEAVTGGMTARAVEPAAGEASGGQAAACLNCGTALIGDYCHRCGQAGRIHRTLTAWWHDLAHGVLHLDGKIWRTLPLLAWRPGELTRRYIEGERARFVSPMAMFLFSVFLMFAVFSALGGPFDSDYYDAGAAAEAARERRAERDQMRGQIEKLESVRAQTLERGGDVTEIDSSLADLRRALGIVGTAARVSGEDEGGFQAIGFTTGWAPLDAAIERANANPSLLLYKVQANAYKFSWALIPLSVPLVWLLFLWRRKYRLYDHVVFVTYSIAFMSLGLIALTLLRPLGLGEGLIGLAVTFVPPVHMYRQLRGAYRLSRLSALWRALFLLVFAFTAATLFLVLLVALGAFA